MCPGPDPEMTLRVLDPRAEIRILGSNLRRVQHDPIRQIPRRKGVVLPADETLPTLRPQPVRRDDQVPCELPAVGDRVHRRGGEVDAVDARVEVECDAEGFGAGEERLLQIDAVEVDEWCVVVFRADVSVEAVFLREDLSGVPVHCEGGGLCCVGPDVGGQLPVMEEARGVGSNLQACADLQDRHVSWEHRGQGTMDEPRPALWPAR